VSFGFLKSSMISKEKKTCSRRGEPIRNVGCVPVACGGQANAPFEGLMEGLSEDISNKILKFLKVKQ